MPLHSIQSLSPTAALGLWHLTEAPEALWPLLPSAYRQLIPPTAGPARQQHWLGARALAHALAAEQLGPAAAALLVHNDAEGRPWLAGATQPLHLSLSHSGEWAAALLSTAGRGGVDVEIIRDKARRLAPMFLSDAELAAAAAQPEASAVLRYSLLWSAKETLYKLAARPGIIFREQLGLAAGLELELSPDFQPQNLPATMQLDGPQTRHCICYLSPAPGYVLTYCHEAGAPLPADS